MLRYLACAAFLFASSEIAAQEKPVFLETADGERFEIATLEITSEGSYALQMSDTAFTDHFLSMRPFKCLEGPEKNWCYVPYPYPLDRDISDDLTDLEYDLLFVWKGATEYGINMWNGVYYQLVMDSSGQITGALHEMDMNLLASPPPEGERPLKASDLHESDADSHWLPRLVID